MPLNAESLKGELIAALESQGFITSNEHAKTKEMCEAIANVVVAHIQANAQVVVASGSSAGTYGVQ